MKTKAYIIKQNDQNIFFGFRSDYPAICAQGDSVDVVHSKLKDFSRIYFEYMGKMEIETQELISL